MSRVKQPGVDREPRFKLFRRTRGGVALTREEVKEIKAERKKLRKQLRDAGLKSKYDFETTASALGLYFDKRTGMLLWFFKGKGLWMTLIATLLLIGSLLAMSMVAQLRGMFTVTLSDHLFDHGFTLSESIDFDNPTTHLFCEAATDVPCISITNIGTDVDEQEGQHNGFGYFAYSYYLRNEGETAAKYKWQLQVTGESKDCSSAAWVMIIEQGKMHLYAEPTATGRPEIVPPPEDTTHGYLEIPVMQLAEDPSQYLKPIKTVGNATYYRIEPQSFASDLVLATEGQKDIEPGQAHKYTIVIWLEGDDPDCIDDRIGGHLGMQMQYALEEEDSDEEGSFWDIFWDMLIFWDD